MKANCKIFPNGLPFSAVWSAPILLLIGVLASFAQSSIYTYTGSETNISLNPGTYYITVYGAQGGTSTVGGYVAGLGAEMEAQFTFTTNVNLTILVGGVGANSSDTGGGGGGGGGGSFVVNGGTPLIVAGGGGGAAGNGTGINGVTQTNGTAGNCNNTYSCENVVAGGIGGSGGQGAGIEVGGGGGGGYYSNGANGLHAAGGGGGAFLNGGFGGTGGTLLGSGSGGAGGFGGGGGADEGAGGGGGYSGGGGGTDIASGYGGGGGGSIIDSSALKILAEVSGVASPDDSPNGEIIITPVPTFITQPSLIAVFTSNVTFQVTVQGAAPLSFQWYFNGAPLSDNGHYIGSTQTNLTIDDFQPADIGDYTLVVSNSAGSTTSAAATITVLNPIVTSQPQGQSALGGDTVTIGVGTTGQQPLNYQWLFDGTNLDGATNNPLTLSNVLVSETGTYSVVVSNNYSAVLSSNATLTVQAMDVFFVSGNQTVPAGGSAQFDVGIEGQQLYYQWLCNGTNLVNNTNFGILMLANLQLSQAGLYSVIVTNPYGATTTSVGNLTVLPLAITTQPKSIISWPGNTIAFSLTTAGVAPFTYQWLYNGTNSLPGTDTNFLVLSNVQPSQFGNYSVIVTNNYESITSSVAALTFSQVAAWGGTSGESNLTTGLTNLIAVSAGDPGYCLALRRNCTNALVGWPHPYTYFG